MELCSGKLRFLGTPGLVVDTCSIHKDSFRRVYCTGGLHLAVRKNCTLGSELDTVREVWSGYTSHSSKVAALCFLLFWK